MSKPINLGDVARDTVTSFEGVAIARSTCIHNCPRWTLQPREKKDGKPIESRSFDEPAVVFVAKTKLAAIPCTRPAEPVELGDTVRDEISGLKGIVTSITEFLAGCVRIGVNPGELKDGVPVGESYFDEVHLSVVKRARAKAPLVRTGGPRPEPRR